MIRFCRSKSYLGEAHRIYLQMHGPSHLDTGHATYLCTVIDEFWPEWLDRLIDSSIDSITLWCIKLLRHFSVFSSNWRCQLWIDYGDFSKILNDTEYLSIVLRGSITFSSQLAFFWEVVKLVLNLRILVEMEIKK